jgi:ubiquinone/menaquinone biosynthesis C-methylase UbiE
MHATRRRPVRFVVVLALFGLAAFWSALHLAAPRPVLPTHPLTGRQIAGMATDASWLDRAAREQEEAPGRALDLIGIVPGMVVADVGAGSGYMTVRRAQRVGPTGKVYANDLQPAMLRAIQGKARAEPLANVEIVEGAETDARLPAGVVDLALLMDVYHEFSHPEEMLRSIRSSLKPGGRLVLVEYRAEDPTIPISPTHRMSVADARREVEAAGFTLVQVIEDLPRQHIIVFEIKE